MIISCRELEPRLLKWVENAPITIESSLIEIGLDSYVRAMDIVTLDEKLSFRIPSDFPEGLSDRGRREIEGWIINALIRSGCLQHLNLQDEVLPKMRIYDDVILAVDTNVILNCVLTSTLLRKGYICSPEIKQPNWVLVVIPKLVMAEIEDWANSKIKREPGSLKPMLSEEAWNSVKGNPHPWSGRPSYRGRVGQRGLQEVLELDTNVDYRGLSIMTVGKLPELYGTDSYRKEVRVDSDIRVQIKEFIKSIDFHKGMFFLTQDMKDAGQTLEGWVTICSSMWWAASSLITARSRNLILPSFSNLSKSKPKSFMATKNCSFPSTKEAYTPFSPSLVAP